MATFLETYNAWRLDDSDVTARSKKILSVPQANTGFVPPVFFPGHTYSQGSRWGHVLIKNAYLALQHSSRLVGWHTTGSVVSNEGELKQVITLNWSSRHRLGEAGNRLHIEHGWLPRWTYQISPLGSNGTSHVAQTFNTRKIEELNIKELKLRIEALKRIFSIQNSLSTIELMRSRLPSTFILCALQLANDENLKNSNCGFSDFYSTSADGNVKFANAIRDYVYSVNPGMSVVFKQHPVDRSDFSQFRIRSNDIFIRNEDGVSTNEIFATEHCKLVLAVNSNTLHEATVWGIPCVSLGTMVWTETMSQRRPYQRELSDGLNYISKLRADVNDFERDDVLSLYLQNLFENQWTLDDLLNPVKVNSLLESVGTYIPNRFPHP